jgi:hypothetical protein
MDLEEKRIHREEDMKKQEIMRKKREEEREKEEAKQRLIDRKENRKIELSKFKLEKESLLSLINDRNKKKMSYLEHLASMQKELAKTKPKELPIVPRAKKIIHLLNKEDILLSNQVIHNDNDDSNNNDDDPNITEVTLFLRKINLEQYSDFFHSHGADRLSDFHYYANQHLDQLKVMLPGYSSTLKHFHQIRFYEELRKHFNITTIPPPPSPSLHSSIHSPSSDVRTGHSLVNDSPNQRDLQSPSNGNAFTELTAGAFVNELITGKRAF